MTERDADVRSAMSSEPESFDRERIWAGIQRGQVLRRRRRQILQSIVAFAACGALWVSAHRQNTGQAETPAVGDSALRAVVAELEATVRAQLGTMESVDKQQFSIDLAIVDSVITELRQYQSRSSAELALLTEQADQALETKAQILRDVAMHLAPLNRISQ
jgi:hypothetical protein